MSPDSIGDRPAASDGGQMTRAAVFDYLAERGTGVLSLAGDPPCSLPMSFAVETSTERFLFQFLSGPTSAKSAFVSDGARASLVAFDRTTPDDWASAIVTGELASVARTPERAAAFAAGAKSVNISVFDGEASELEGSWYELRPASVTGRCGPAWNDPNKFGETG